MCEPQPPFKFILSEELEAYGPADRAPGPSECLELMVPLGAYGRLGGKAWTPDGVIHAYTVAVTTNDIG